MKKTTFLLYLKKITLIIFLGNISVYAQEVTKLNGFNDVVSLLKNKNYSLVNAELQKNIAELTKKVAVANAFNPRVPTTIQAYRLTLTTFCVPI